MSCLLLAATGRCHGSRHLLSWRVLGPTNRLLQLRSESNSSRDSESDPPKNLLDRNTASNPRRPINDSTTRSSHSIWIPDSGRLWSRVQTGVRPLTLPLRAYGRAQEARPYTTQIFSSLAIYFLGDLLSQYIEHSPVSDRGKDGQDGENPNTQVSEAETSQWHYDPYRSVRALIIGGTFSLPSYHWFLFLSHWRAISFPHRPYFSLVARILVHQIVFSPVFNTYFFSMQSLLSLEGPQPEKAWARVKETVPTSVMNSWKFWPLVTAFSFTFVRPRSRSVFGGVVAVGWQAYLGLLNERARWRDERVSVGA